MFRTVAVFAAFFVSLSAFGATLGPEQRVSPVAPLTRAASWHVEPDVASDGHGFVACWTDDREAPLPLSGLDDAIYATHFDRDGAVEPLTDVQIGYGSSSRIASNQSGYVVAYLAGDGVYTRHLDRFAQPSGPPTLAVPSSGSAPVALGSDGSGYLLVLQTSTTFQVAVRLLDSYGRPTNAEVLLVNNASPSVSVVTTSDGVYHLIHLVRDCLAPFECGRHIEDLSVNARTGAVAAKTLVVSGAYSDLLAAATSGTRILVAFTSNGSLAEEVFDAAGNETSEVRTVSEAPVEDSTSIGAGWDGSNFLVTLAHQSVTSGVRIGPSGDVLDASPFSVAEGTRSVALAFGGGESALVDSTRSDILGLAITSFDELPRHPQLLRLSNAPAVQRSVAAAEVSNGLVTVWREGDGDGSIMAAVVGRRITIASESQTDVQHDPDIASAGGIALVAWRSDANGRRRVLAKRIAGDGTVIDTAPIVVDDVANSSGEFRGTRDRVSVATSGREFLVAWSAGDILARRVALDGTTMDAEAIRVTAPQYSTEFEGVRCVWTGSNYVVVSQAQTYGNLSSPEVDLVAARVTAAGVALDASQNVHVYRQFAAGWSDLSVAAGRDRLAIAWMERALTGPANAAVKAILLPVESLTSNANVRVIEEHAPPPNWFYGIGTISVAAHAGAFAAIWTYGYRNPGGTRAALVESGDPLIVTTDNSFDVAAVPMTSGIALMYARTDAEAANVSQLFMRVLTIPPARHRAASR